MEVEQLPLNLLWAAIECREGQKARGVDCVRKGGKMVRLLSNKLVQRSARISGGFLAPLRSCAIVSHLGNSLSKSELATLWVEKSIYWGNFNKETRPLWLDRQKLEECSTLLSLIPSYLSAQSSKDSWGLLACDLGQRVRARGPPPWRQEEEKKRHDCGVKVEAPKLWVVRVVIDYWLLTDPWFRIGCLN